MLDFVCGCSCGGVWFCLVFVLFHSLTDAHLVYHYLLSFAKRKKRFLQGLTTFSYYTLPIYNEVYVAERLIDVVAAIDILRKN
jgi:hypothetical protein